jgi:uracil-DNA glycosylase
MVNIGNDWDILLAEEFRQGYYLQLREFLKSEYKQYAVHPDMKDIFTALKLTPYAAVKAVILGQDPYHEPGQAQGLAFSVRKGIRVPPSLQNIFKELESDLGLRPPAHGELIDWANQGVLLLNTVLTVREGQANSHKGRGWERLTDRIIQLINEREQPTVFLLWGSNARSKAPLITNPVHKILQCAHPSPLSAFGGFFGCRHFSKCNAFLQANGIEGIDWGIK